MDLLNYTPFSPFVFESRDWDEDDHFVIVVRGTFKVVPGRSLIPIPEQQPIVVADQYYGEPLKSSLRSDSDLAPFKLASDIFLVGSAKSPGGEPCRRWRTALQAGSLRYEADVTGPRNWSYTSVGGWSLSSPEPCRLVPLKHEMAFGGSVGDGAEDAFPLNPVGLGYSTRRSRRTLEPFPAPQIESPGHPISDIAADYDPAGYAPIPKTSPQRLQYAGTYDDAWKESRWPNLPEDFDYRYYNAARPELQVEEMLRGDEEFKLEGFQHEGPVTFRLPGYTLRGSIQDEDDYTTAVDLSLDTVEIDVDNWVASLVWRGSELKTDEIEQVTLTMSGGDL